MAEHLASIFGTEKDRVNCPFYFKIGCEQHRHVIQQLALSFVALSGMFACSKLAVVFLCRACRHGDRCSRLHNKPTISQTLLLQNMYQNPALNAPPGPDGLPMPIDARQSQEHFEVCATLCKALFLP